LPIELRNFNSVKQTIRQLMEIVKVCKSGLIANGALLNGEKALLLPLENLGSMGLSAYRGFYKRNLVLAFPVMMSQAGQVIVQQVDNIMVGAVGTTELAASSFANSIFIIGMTLGMGFTFGLTPLVGHAWATGNHRHAGALFRNSMVSNMLGGTLLVFVLYGVSFFMDNMGQPEGVVQLAVPYYRILVLSLLPFLLFFTFKQFSEGLGNTKVAMYITLFVNVVNVVLNYLLIFGHFGFPALGLNGAGISTLVARVLMPMIFFAYFLHNNRFRRYLMWFRHARTQMLMIKEIVSVGWPIGMQMLLEVTAFAMSCVMAGWIGEIPLAAHQIALGLSSVAYMIVTGIGSGTTIRVSHQYSAGQYTDMKTAAYASVHLVLAFMSLTAISFFSFRYFLPTLYTNNPEVIHLAASLIIFAGIFQLFDGLQVVLLGALRGLADVKHPMIYCFFAYFVVNMPVSYFFAFVLGWGTPGIWVGFVLGLGLAALFFYLRFTKLTKKIMN
jgi:MATE family multidrug resistance protein